MTEIETQLPPYVRDRPCPKCGSDTIATLWRAADPDFPREDPEHMVRTCGRCGFSWKEAPLDGGATQSARDNDA